ncbi:MAG: 3'(2'),5'-bisphosphate nucleotidase CysQ [Thermoleophilia bacterium]|nr:3'(2'),5'-bisphosphate nucleotidase CysQ [Thermoleophilia bacterium]
MSAGDWRDELETAIAAARAAGAAIRELYEGAGAAVYAKDDCSPVTDADLAADRIIRARLSEAYPADAILTEEGVDDAARLAADRVWFIDPIDGTHQFIARTGEFDVLIALVVDGRPVVGVVWQPVTGRHFGAAAGAGAFEGIGDERRPLAFLPVPAGVAPRLQASVWLNARDGAPALERVAASLGAATPTVSELGVVLRRFVPPDAEFDAMLAPPKTRDHRMAWEWDYAAADVIVHEAGGRFTNAYGEPLRYNKPVPRNGGGLILAVDPATHARIVEAFTPELP